ncbi:MAG: lactate dehydrogenase [Paenibacillus sp.]|jgi:glycolate oxidase FAD binding subunit|nr:lactate dehydrogenase [Paenibacillus sp.]
MDGTETAFPVKQALTRIREIVGPHLVSAADPEVSGSPYKIEASLIVSPENEDQVSRLLHLASANGYRVVPQGGATKDAQGGALDRTDVLLSMKKMSGILKHSVGDLMVTALPGTTVNELQETLQREGQFLPIDPAWGTQSTIGGMVAANVSGPKRALYGSARDHLIASRVVLADGTAIKTGAKVVKNVAGYDMNKLFVGSMGTIGVLTEVTFKIRPLPASAGLAAFRSRNCNEWRLLQEALLDSQLEPCAVELLCPGAAEELFGTPESVFLVLFEDVESSVRYQLDWVKSYAAGLGLTPLAEVLGRDATEPVIERLRSITPNSNEATSDRLDVSLKLLSSMTDVPDIYEFAMITAEQAGFQLRFSGGLFTGISHAAISTDWQHLQGVVQWIHRIHVYMEQVHGNAILSFAPKQVRTAVSVWGTPRNDYDLMRGVKQQFDPARILNRGRFAGGI